MKKMMLTCLLLGATSFAFANDAAKVKLVKKMYQEANATDRPEIVLKKYADANFKRALKSGDKADSEGWTCLDHVIMWQSQGDKPSSKVTVSMGNNGLVKVSWTGWNKTTLYYDVKCSGSSCKVADVIAPKGWGSYKELSKC